MAHAIQNGYNSLSLLFVLNWDRFLSVAAIALALLLAAFVGSSFG